VGDIDHYDEFTFVCET